jgi:hypothetical protein
VLGSSAVAAPSGRLGEVGGGGGPYMSCGGFFLGGGKARPFQVTASIKEKKLDYRCSICIVSVYDFWLRREMARERIMV